MASSWSDVLEADDPQAFLEAESWATLLRFCELSEIDVKSLDLTEGKANLIARLLARVESELAERRVSGGSISARREWIRDKFEAVSERAQIATEQEGAAGTVIKVTGKAVSGGKEVLQAAANKVITKSAQLISLETYRDELEQLVDEALRVIAVQEDRIARLEEKLGDAHT